MNTKLTLRMDEAVVRRAKAEARRRGKSVSQMIAEYIDAIAAKEGPPDLPPVTAALVGLLKDAPLSEALYKKHLREKHL